MPDKIPPQNIEAEQAVLGSILLDNKKIKKVLEILDSDCFYQDKHKIIFKTIISLKIVDFITLSDKLKESEQLDSVGGISYLTELLDTTASPENVETYALIVKEKSLRRKIINEATAIKESGHEEDISSLATKAESILSCIKSGSGKNAESDLGDPCDYNSFMQKEIRSVEYWIDNIVPKNNAGVMISGDRGHGKSLNLLQMAIDLTIGQAKFLKFNITGPARVLLLDLENGDSVTKERLLKMLGDKIPDGLYLHYLPSFNITDASQLLWLKNRLSELKIDVLIIDPLKNCWTGNLNNEQEVTVLTKIFQQLQLEHGITVVFGHHHRKFKKGDLITGDLAAGSYALSGYVFMHIMLQNDVTNQTVTCEKTRGEGFTGFNQKLDLDTLRFQYISDLTGRPSKQDPQILRDLFDGFNKSIVARIDLEKTAHERTICGKTVITDLLNSSTEFETLTVAKLKEQGIKNLKGKADQIFVRRKLKIDENNVNPEKETLYSE